MNRTLDHRLGHRLVSSPWLARLTILALACTCARYAAAQGGHASPTSCCPSPGTSGPCCIGQWDAVPYNPPISCVPGTPGCCSDEIAHAALIPSGTWPVGITPGGLTTSIAGMVLVWTRCDDQPGYTTHIWDPSDPGGVAYAPAIIDRINADGTEDGPFCSGHAWILDDAKNPKLLVVGGQDRGDDDSMTPEAFEDQDPGPGFYHPCAGSGAGICGLHKVYWFNPMAANPENAWSDDPPDLTDGRWYPTVTTHLNSAGTQFLPIVFGGSPKVTPGCGSTRQFSNWWTLAQPLTGPWSTHGSSYFWHWYPRPFQVSGPSILTVGHAVLCEDDVPTNPFGGNPTSIVSAGQAWSAGPSPNPDDTTLVNATGGGWHYSNAAILHTLNNLTYTETNPEQRYDLDRILVTGGSQRREDGDLAQAYTHELFGGQWTVKSSPVTPRVYANWVILPDGNLLLVGGSSSNDQTNPQAYYSSIERFTPQGPQNAGFWRTMAPRPDVVTPTGTLPPPARGYHHVAMMLQDGRVAVMGGKRPSTGMLNDIAILPWSRVEIYNPGYTFESSRLKITGTQSADMTYGTPYFWLSCRFSGSAPGPWRCKTA